MNKLRRTGAIVSLSLTLAVSAFAGTIHTPGGQDPKPPTGQSTTITSISTEDPTAAPMEISTEISTEIIILTILGLIS